MSSLASARARGYLIVLLGVLTISPEGLLIRLIDESEMDVVFWRGIFLALSLSCFLILKDRKKAYKKIVNQGMISCLCAAFFAISAMTFVTAISMSSVADTLIILSTAPLFAAVLGYFFLKEKTGISTWLAITFSFVGVCIVFSGAQGSRNVLGYIFALIAASTMAANWVLIRKCKLKNTLPALILSGVLSSLISLPFISGAAINTENILLMVLLGGVLVPIAMGLIALGPTYLPAPEVGLILLLETVLAPIWVWFVLEEVPALNVILGGTLILLTMSIFYFSKLTVNKSS